MTMDLMVSSFSSSSIVPPFTQSSLWPRLPMLITSRFPSRVNAAIRMFSLQLNQASSPYHPLFGRCQKSHSLLLHQLTWAAERFTTASSELLLIWLRLINRTEKLWYSVMKNQPTWEPILSRSKPAYGTSCIGQKSIVYFPRRSHLLW